ncbi:hypothetical protein FB451DRAFT_1410367 [Mycena latifolia]|nr:hypothetical protein FB451DRAFT_1410367 [Mycena latifolia]
MPTSNTSPTRPSRKPTATSFGPFQPNPQSDWLAPSLLTAKTMSAAVDGVPFPYVKGAFGVIVILLETLQVSYLPGLSNCRPNHQFLQKAKKNRDDLKELCENSMKIMEIIRDQLLSQEPTVAEKLKSVCEELER